MPASMALQNTGYGASFILLSTIGPLKIRAAGQLKSWETMSMMPRSCRRSWPSPPKEEDIASVTADGTYDTRRCGAIAKNETLRATDRLGLTIWRWWKGYHRRSRIEAKMHCIKLLGLRLTAPDFKRQITEVHVCMAILNRFTALGIPLTQAVS